MYLCVDFYSARTCPCRTGSVAPQLARGSRAQCSKQHSACYCGVLLKLHRESSHTSGFSRTIQNRLNFPLPLTVQILRTITPSSEQDEQEICAEHSSAQISICQQFAELLPRRRQRRLPLFAFNQLATANTLFLVGNLSAPSPILESSRGRRE